MTAPGDDDLDQGALAAESEASIGGGEGGDQDDLVAEWESMVGGDGDSDSDSDSSSLSRESTHILNQDEIDSLLGFDEE